MLKELLDAVVELGREADEVQIVREFKDGTIHYREPGGSIEELKIPPDPRGHKALDLSAIIEFASNHADSAIWYSRCGVVCLIDDETRRDRVTLDLSFSPQLRLLIALEQNPKAYTQAELVLMLRTTLAGCFADDASGQLLPAIRAVKFTRNSEGESAIDHGKASIGKKLTEQATGAVAIPEVVTFRVPIFARAFAFVGRIKCAVDIDASTETFKLIPLPLEIEHAISAAEIEIRKTLEEAGTETPIRYGTP